MFRCVKGKNRTALAFDIIYIHATLEVSVTAGCAFAQVSKTTAKDDKNNVINGFKKSLSSRQAPPKLLKLKPEDQAIVVSI